MPSRSRRRAGWIPAKCCAGVLFSVLRNACDFRLKVLHSGGIHRGGFSMTDGPSTPPPLPPAGSSNLFTRVIGLIVNPAAEWRKIDGESTSLGKLVITYALILAAILPIAMLLGALIQGGGRGMGSFILVILIFYALEIGVTVATAFIIDALAPSLGGTKNMTQAAKLAVYASTPLFLLGILGIFIIGFLLFGSLSWVWVLAGVGWGSFLLFLGLPILMRVPQDKAPAYVGAVAGAWALLWVLALVIARSIMWSILFGGYGYAYGVY